MFNLFPQNSAILFVLVFVTSISLAQDDKLFQEGNEYYRQKQYDKAIITYNQLVRENFESAALYYNLGNAYFRMERIGYAILYYEKALKLAPNDEDIVHNLTLANLKIIDKVESLPKFFLFQWWEGLLSLFTSSGWTIISYICYIILIISIGFYFYIKTGSQQKIVLISGFAGLLLLIISSSVLAVKLKRELNIKNGIVVENTANVKLSPDSGSNDAFIVHEGLKVILEDRVDEWVKVRLQDGKVGWLPQEDVKVI
jgi:tetratricopeptide (TPR) repeat protein